MIITLASYSLLAHGESELLSKTLPLECQKIPNRESQLCFIVTQSPFGPFDDVVFYHRDKNGYMSLLGSHSGEVATFGGVDFSTGGTFMWLSWAEEGHPHFKFYYTGKFISNGLSAKSVSVLGDYYFDGFEKFTDKGEVIYRLADDAYEDCNNAGKGVSYTVNSETAEKYCVKRFNLDLKGK